MSNSKSKKDYVSYINKYIKESIKKNEDMLLENIILISKYYINQ